MDPNIMKILEEDEDETMHSGADVDAFTAALNRDIEGDNSTPQPSDSDSGAVSHGSSNTPSQFLSPWQPSSNNESASCQTQQDPACNRQHEQHSSEIELKKYIFGSNNQQQHDNTSQIPTHPPPQQEPSPEDASQQLKAEQDNPQNVNSKQAQGTGISDQSSTATEMSNQQFMGAGVNGQQLATMGGNHQQATAPGLSHQQSTTSGMSNHQSVTMGISNQQSMTLGISNQQSLAMGMSSQQSLAIGMSNHQHVAVEMTSQQAGGTGMNNQQGINALNRGKQVPFALLLPVITPQLDKDRGMQLQTLYQKLKKNEISKEMFVRHMRSIVGDQMLKMAVYKLQTQAARNPRAVTNQQPMPVPANEGSNPNNNAFPQREVDRRGESRGLQASQMITSSLNASRQERDHPAFPIQGINKQQQQQQHLHFAQASFATYGGTGSNYHPFSTSNASTPVTSLKQQTHDSHMRHIPAQQSVNAPQLGSTSQAINMANAPKFEKRMQGGTLSHMPNNSSLHQNAVQWHSPNISEQRSGVPPMAYVKQEPGDQSNDQQQRSQLSTSQGLSSFVSVHTDLGNANPGTLKEESFDMQSSRLGFSAPTSNVPSTSVSSTTTSQMEQNHPLNSRIQPSPVPPANNAKTPQKKPSVGQKKPLEALGSSPPSSSKKQKVSGGFSDQSIEQLNDVTAVSGVNLREEEEQLFSGTKEESRVSEASRRVVQEEEERLILQKVPLQKKLAEIMVKCGLKGIGNDVEKCLSLCVEERMRGLISNLIRLSKQRVDIEKPRHRTVVTSDVRQHIMAINRKAREALEKKQAEAEKLQKLNEPDGNSTTVDSDKEKDEGRARSVKVNKEDDSKTRTTAANVAARAAFGGDDMLSKWQLMAEQARQKREGGTEAAPGSQSGKDTTRKPSSFSGRSAGDHQEAEKRGHSSAARGAIRKVGRNHFVVAQNRVARTISVKDVIAVLEREPQMSKSTLMYRLYEKIGSGATTE